MKKFKYEASADDSLDAIKRAVGNEARVMARDEFADKIEKNPHITPVDYSIGQKEVSLNDAPKTHSGKDPYDMYSHTGNKGEITSERTTPEREHYVAEIFKNGTKKLSTCEDFEKKIAESSPNEEDISALNRIVRVSSKTPEAYANAEERNQLAYSDFDKNKYLIEETAARRNIPPALLSAIYYKTIADEGSITANTPAVRYAKLSYNRLYGHQLSWDDETLAEYLKTPEGALDFIAIGLRSEAKYQGFNTDIMTQKQLNTLLSGYNFWNKKSPEFESSVMAYNEVFENIFKKNSSEDYDVKLI